MAAAISGSGDVGAAFIQQGQEAVSDARGSMQVPIVLKDDIERMEESYATRIGDLEEQRANADGPTLALDQEIADLKTELRDFYAEIGDVMDSKFENLSNAAYQGGFDEAAESKRVVGEISDIVSNMRSTLASSYAEVGMTASTDAIEVPSGQFEKAAPDPSGNICGTHVNIPNSDHLSNIRGVEGNVHNASGRTSELTSMLQNDPDAFREAMAGMDANERTYAMMEVQEQLQQANQMFSMMTQFAQVQHDTAKAVIQNMRV